MTTTHLTVPESHADRRLSPRRRLPRLAYVHFGLENGGVLIDVSEGGLHCQVVGALTEGQSFHVKFILPGTSAAIEAKCEVVWCNASKHGGGLRFVDLEGEARRRLSEWISTEEPAAPPASHPPSPYRSLSTQAIAAKLGAATGAGERPAAAHDQQSRLALALAAVAEPVLHRPAAPKPQKRIQTENSEPPATAQAPVGRASGTPPPAMRAESFVAPAARLLPQQGTFDTRPAVRKGFALGAIIFVVLAALATQFGRVFSLVTSDAANSVASAASPSAPKVVRPFEVEVIDAANGRFFLNNEDAGGAIATATVAPPDVAPAGTAPPTVRASSAIRPAAPALRANASNLLLQHPHFRAPVATNVFGAPAVAENVVGPVDALSAQPVAPPPAAEPQPPLSYPSTPRIQPPVLIHREDPLRPPLAGTIRVAITIGVDGVPQQISWSGGDSRLLTTAVDTIKRWRYQPALLSGRPVESQVVVTLTVNFRQ